MHFRPDPQALRGFQTRERQEEGVARIEDDDYLQFLRANGFDHVYDPMGQRSEMYYIPQPSQLPARLHATQWVADRSLAFLRERDKSQPFFLFTSFLHPHPPFSPPTPWNKLYRAPMMPMPKEPRDCESLHTHINRHQNRYKFRDNGIDYNLLRCIKAYYYACISFIDFQVGRLLAELESSGELDNTLIVYTSDHGEFLGDYRCFGKRSMLDAAARVPLMVRYPERFAVGHVCDTPISLVDLLPTVASAAGVDADAYRSDGMDLAALAAHPPEERTVFSQFQNGALAQYMAVDERFKYVYSSSDRREFLFHRLEDPDETRSRAGVPFCHGKVAEMRQRLWARLRADGFDRPFDGEAWRLYPQPQWPADPDAGLLIQDHPWSAAHLHVEGYSE